MGERRIAYKPPKRLIFLKLIYFSTIFWVLQGERICLKADIYKSKYKQPLRI